MKRSITVFTIIVLSILFGLILNMELGLLSNSQAEDNSAGLKKRDTLHTELSSGKTGFLTAFSKVSEMASPERCRHARNERDPLFQYAPPTAQRIQTER